MNDLKVTITTSWAKNRSFPPFPNHYTSCSPKAAQTVISKTVGSVFELCRNEIMQYVFLSCLASFPENCICKTHWWF